MRQIILRPIVTLLAGLSLFVFGTPGITPSAAAESQDVTFPVDGIVLHADLFKPVGAGPFPAVLWNHGGSSPNPGSSKYRASRPLGEVFVSQGYVLLVLHRRGYGRSPRDPLSDQFIAEKRVDERNKLQLELINVHLRDLKAAVHYLENLPFVASDKIAVAGCSFGGILTVFAAETELPIRAVLDFSGAAISWKQSPELRERMLKSVRAAKVPVLLIQAENDYDVNPSRELAKTLEHAKKPHRIVIFPAFGSTARQGHSFCVRGREIWKAEVFSFLGNALQ